MIRRNTAQVTRAGWESGKLEQINADQHMKQFVSMGRTNQKPDSR